MASDALLTFTDGNFKDEVLTGPIPVLVDFWAEWCGPCRMITPLLEDLASEYEGQVKFGKVNVDSHPNLAAEYRVSGIPTRLLFKDGQVQDVIVGLKSKRDLKASIERVLTPA